MNSRSAFLGQVLILAISLAISGYYYSVLPEVVPTHWNIHGQVDQYGSRWISLLMMPGPVVLIMLMTIALPYLSPKNFEVTRSGKAYGEIMLLVSGLMGMLHIIILAGTAQQPRRHRPLDVQAGLFVFFALIGNVMGKIKRNFYMGVRTPWTLADERVWTETHRVAAHEWFLGGIVGALLTLVGVPMGIMIAYFVIMALLPVPASFLIYKRLEPRHLNGLPPCFRS